MPDSSHQSASVQQFATSEKTTSVTHVAVWLSRRSAGVGKIGLELGIAQQQHGANVRWVCLDDPNLGNDIRDAGINSLSDVQSVRPVGPKRLGWAPGLRQVMEPLIRDSDVVHLHGIWAATSHAAAKLAKRLKRPYILAPHGMLEPWALQHHHWRKKIIAALRERKLVQQASCIHATADAEVDGIRSFGYRGPIAKIPNGLNLSHYDLSSNRPSTNSRPRQFDDRRVALFLSRLHPKKGLPLYLESWAALKKHHQDWHLVIVGPDENGHQAELESIVKRLGLNGSVSFLGPVYGDEKISLTRAADLFVLPSHSEGFSMAVLEAMACELPVLITHGCNFPQVASEGAGFVVDRDLQTLRDATENLMLTPREELLAMGRAGRSLIERRYTWSHVADQMEEVYRWLLNGMAGPAPSCIDTIASSG